MRVSRQLAVLVATMALATRPSQASIGDFGASYGRAGFVDNPWAVLQDGRLLYFSDDASFGSFSPYDFVLSTSSSTQFQRVDLDGKPDPAYGIGGRQTLLADFQYTYTSVRTADGKLLLGGSLRMQPALLRTTLDGSLDTTFGNMGFVAATDSAFLSVGPWIAALAVQPDGRVLALANDRPFFKDIPTVAVLRRFNADGTLDNGFPARTIAASSGQSSCAACNGPVAVLPGGAIRVGGVLNPVYFSAAGTLIASPASSGVLPPNTSNWKIATLLPAGGSLISGTTTSATNAAGDKADAGTDVLLGRLRADGTLDGSFGNAGSGYATFDIGQLALGRSGLFQYVLKTTVSSDERRVYLAVALSTKLEGIDGFIADSGTAIVRLLIASDGRVSVDPTFGRGGIVLLPPEVHALVEDVVEQSSGAVILTLSDGWARWALRLLGSPSGSRGVIAVDRYYSEAREPDGELVVRVGRTRGSDGTISVTYRTQDNFGASNAATPGTDYVPTSGQLDWADGDTSDRFIRVQLKDDSVAESTERISIAMTAPSDVNFNYTPGASTILTAGILDDDAGTSTPASPTTGSTTSMTASANGGGGALDVLTLGLALLGILPACRRRHAVRSSQRGLSLR